MDAMILMESDLRIILQRAKSTEQSAQDIARSAKSIVHRAKRELRLGAMLR